MKITLIINGRASSMTPRQRVVITRALAHDHDVNAVETQKRGHATRLAQGAVAEGVDAVLVMGGDGTANEVANGLAGSSVAFGIIPAGSTYVFARTLGMTNDPIEATGELLQSLQARNISRIGLGVVNDRYFLFHVGVGLDAAVVEQVERQGWIKRYAGHPFFIMSAFRTMARLGGSKTPFFSIDFRDGGPVVDGFFTICMNTNPYTYLGNRPINVVPELTADDGLAVLTVRSIKAPTSVSVVLSALMSGRLLRRHKDTDLRTDVSECVITAHGQQKFPYQLDGEYLGEVSSLRLRHEPKVIDVLLPVG